MDDVDGRARHLGEGDGAVGGFGFGEGGAAEGVEVRRGLAFGDHLGDDDVDGRAVFGVDAAEGVERGGPLHYAEHEAVVDHQDVRVGHEELEGGDALGDHLVHFAEVFEVLGRGR